MPLIGTAGHVDHGKSTLIQAITGRNPDRWQEEQTRGLTIDLGFAWTTLPDGREASFVDVPGHERYLKNMLAGIEAIDVALFVVAADEGWMPQSEEHLAVLDLLDVSRAVIALTKVDTVDPELADVAEVEIEDRLVGTSLEGSPIVRVSGTEGIGIDILLDELAAVLPDDPPANGRPRMWVDRSFPVPGAGTVVTGSLLDSWLAVDDQVVIYPHGATARVRSIQSHEKSSDRVSPGRRVALNLSGVDHRAVERGEMVGLPEQWVLSKRFAARIRTARFVEDFDQRGAYQLHIGSSAHSAVITGLEGGAALFALDRPLALAVGDRFIVRDTGRKLVVAGGTVVDPGPGKTRKALARVPGVAAVEPPDAIASRLLAARGTDSLSRLAAHSGGGRPTSALTVGDTAVDPAFSEQLTRRAVQLVREEHLTNPLRPGLPLATLATRLGVTGELAEMIVDGSTDLRRDGPTVAAFGHEGRLGSDQDAAWKAARDRIEESLAVPAENDLGLDPEVLAHLIREGELVRIAPGLVYRPKQLEEIVAVMRGLDAEFTVAEFRDQVGLSRKYVVPILEWTDKEGLTSRRGDVRHIR
ncbi:MAG TPA: selenocysteine-specific translation elongation factor [Acidimicrobiia bacterium]|nr:selenocysteine-specific translation elongation factor [Acidimicrobiia bacterium]